MFGIQKPILHLVSDYLFSFEHKFRKYTVKIQNLTVKDNAPFQIQKLNCYFFSLIKTIVIIVVSLVLMHKTLSDWRYVIIAFRD